MLGRDATNDRIFEYTMNFGSKNEFQTTIAHNYQIQSKNVELSAYF